MLQMQEATSHGHDLLMTMASRCCSSPQESTVMGLECSIRLQHWQFTVSSFAARHMSCRARCPGSLQLCVASRQRSMQSMPAWSFGTWCWYHFRQLPVMLSTSQPAAVQARTYMRDEDAVQHGLGHRMCMADLAGCSLGLGSCGGVPPLLRRRHHHLHCATCHAHSQQ